MVWQPSSWTRAPGFREIPPARVPSQSSSGMAGTLLAWCGYDVLPQHPHSGDSVAQAHVSGFAERARWILVDLLDWTTQGVILTSLMGQCGSSCLFLCPLDNACAVHAGNLDRSFVLGSSTAGARAWRCDGALLSGVFPLEQSYLQGADCNGRRTDYTLELFYTLWRRDVDRVKLITHLWLRQLDELISHMPVTTWPQCYIASDSPLAQLQSTPQHVPFRSGDGKHGQVVMKRCPAATSDTVPQSPVGEELRCPRPPGSPAAFAVLRGQRVGPNAVDGPHEFHPRVRNPPCLEALYQPASGCRDRCRHEGSCQHPSTQKKGTSQGTSHGAGSQTSKKNPDIKGSRYEARVPTVMPRSAESSQELSTAAMS